MDLNQMKYGGLLLRMQAADSDAERVLQAIRAGSLDDVGQALSTLEGLGSARMAYLRGLSSLATGDIMSALNGMITYCAGDPPDPQAFHNLGLALEAGYDQSQAKNLLDMAFTCHNAAWKKDPAWPLANDALRDFHRDRLNATDRLLKKMAEQPRVVLEPTTYCHLKCQGCTRTIEDTPSMHMSLDVFRRVIDHLPARVSDIVMHGLGEPTLNKQLPEMIRYARDSGKTDVISFSTTGMTKDFSVYERCFDSGLSYLRMSVDSLDPDIAEICRKGSNVEQMETTIRKMVARGLSLEIVMVVSSFNLDDMEKTLARLDELGKFKVRGMLYLDKGVSAGNLDEAGIQRANQVFQDMKAKARQIDLTWLNHHSPSTYELCSSVSDITVDVGGYLTPCCHVYDRSIHGYLSLADHDFEEIRESDYMKKFVAQYVDQAPDFCGGCLANCRSTQRNGYPGQRSFKVPVWFNASSPVHFVERHNASRDATD